MDNALWSQVVPCTSSRNIIKIQGTASSTALRFDIDLQRGSPILPNDIGVQVCLHLLDRYLSLNSFQRGVWGKEQRRTTLIRPADRFEIIVSRESNQYKVVINAQHSLFMQRVHYSRISRVVVEGNISVLRISYVPHDGDALSGACARRYREIDTPTIRFSPPSYETAVRVSAIATTLYPRGASYPPCSSEEGSSCASLGNFALRGLNSPFNKPAPPPPYEIAVKLKKPERAAPPYSAIKSNSERGSSYSAITSHQERISPSSYLAINSSHPERVPFCSYLAICSHPESSLRNSPCSTSIPLNAQGGVHNAEGCSFAGVLRTYSTEIWTACLVLLGLAVFIMVLKAFHLF